jgi:uncharacterized protein (DUF488 family)
VRTVLTVGHSTHSAEEFESLLRGAGVQAVADVRLHPGSRRFPHFARQALARSLPAVGIDYVHLPELGGRRRPAPASANGGWENAAFRGYADHMATDEFAAALTRLEDLARGRPTAVVCAEALWWRCHRRLVADALTVRGWEVDHLAADGSASRHELTAFAVPRGTGITYPPEQTTLGVG